MSDSAFREILSSMRALGAVAPPPDAAAQPIEATRGRLKRRLHRRRRLVLSALAAMLVVGFGTFALTRKPHLEPLAPLDQLKQAVQASNDYHGVVQMQLTERSVPNDQPLQDDNRVMQVDLPAGNGVTEVAAQPLSGLDRREADALQRRARMQAEALRRIAQTQATTRVSNASTILIPLTWEGARTIPIPLAGSTVPIQPVPLDPDFQVTRKDEGALRVFRVENAAANLPLTLQRPNEATVWVDPNTNLIQRIDVRSQEKTDSRISTYEYFYGNGAATTAPSR